MDIIGNKTLRELWRELARTHGDKTALVFEDAEGDTSEFSYAELDRQINRAANLFLSLGVEKGGRVAVQLCNCPEMIFCWFGLAKIGAVMVPMNTQYIYRESEYLLDKCGAEHVVVAEEFLPIYEKMRNKRRGLKNILVARIGEAQIVPGTLNFNKLLKEQPAELSQLVELGVEDIAEILFTSGTTSKPKGAVITHYNLRFAGYYTAWQCALRSDDRYLTMMPAFHVDFQCTAAMPAFTAGATLIMLEKYSARKFWRQVCAHRATITECIPLMIRTLLLQPVCDGEKEHCLREIFYYLNLADHEKDAFIERFNVRLLTSYGMTETIVGLVGDRPGDARRWPSIGRVGLCYEAKIINAEGRELPPGEVGELYVRGEPGKTLFKEYYNDPDATARIFNPDGWLHTGDNAWMDEDDYFYFVDRNVNMIKRSGENISSSEIENILMGHPKIAEAAVIGVPDSIRDKAVKAFILVKESQSLTGQEVLDYCAEHLACFKVPSYVEICADFPRTCTGKVQKKYLSGQGRVAPESQEDC